MDKNTLIQAKLWLEENTDEKYEINYSSKELYIIVGDDIKLALSDDEVSYRAQLQEEGDMK
jgi:hypothetical protein